MRWWACDSGHSVPIEPTTLKITRAKCPYCIDGVTYRIEIDVPEDDPSRLVDAP
jgi:hypothetical protein